MAQELPVVDSIWQSQRLKIPVIVFFFCGIFLLAFGGGLFLFRSNQKTPDIQIISPASSQSAEIIIHVDGEVKNPGVYKLPANSRISDAILKAGGLLNTADTKNINLAAKVSDGQKIYVFAVGEGVTSNTQQVTGKEVNQGSLININTAAESELDKLPGIGPVTAQKIIASRPYSSLEDLLTKKAVSRSTFNKIKELISL